MNLIQPQYTFNFVVFILKGVSKEGRGGGGW